jgi:hypothetical protein
MWRDNLLNGKPLARCPMRDLLDADEDLLAELGVNESELYPLFRRGFLYSAGGVADQPARYISWMREIDDARDLAQAKYIEITMPKDETTG